LSQFPIPKTVEVNRVVIAKIGRQSVEIEIVLCFRQR